jgi:SnoaL-like protein
MVTLAREGRCGPIVIRSACSARGDQPADGARLNRCSTVSRLCFSNGQSCSYEVLSAGVSGDLGYVAAIERSVASTGGGKAEQYTLRVTTIFRCEEQWWKVVHRHGDPLDQPSRDSFTRRQEHGAM